MVKLPPFVDESNGRWFVLYEISPKPEAPEQMVSQTSALMAGITILLTTHKLMRYERDLPPPPKPPVEQVTPREASNIRL